MAKSSTRVLLASFDKLGVDKTLRLAYLAYCEYLASLAPDIVGYLPNDGKALDWQGNVYNILVN